MKIAVASPAGYRGRHRPPLQQRRELDEVLSQLGNENVELVQDEDDIDLTELEKAPEAPVVKP